MPELSNQIILREFLDQSTGLLDRVDRDLADIDRTGDAPKPSGGGSRIAGALRSIRSGAAFLELTDLVSAATRAESLLRQIDAGSLDVAKREVASLRSIVDSLRGAVPSTRPASVEASPISDPANTEIDAAAMNAADRIEASIVPAPLPSLPFQRLPITRTPAPEPTPEPATPFRPRSLADLFAESCTAVANIAAQAGRDIRPESRGGETEVDESIHQVLRTVLAATIAHTTTHAAESTDAASPAQVIQISAEPEGTQVCIRIEAPVPAPASWASDAHLDDARRAIEESMGSYECSADSPTTTIRLPANPARFDAMVTRAGDTLCAIPTAQVAEVIIAGASQISSIGSQRTVQFHGAAIPLLDARAIFGAGASPRPSRYIIVIRCAGRRIALVVDRVLGRQELTLPPTPIHTSTPGPIRAAATTPDGAPTLVIDIPALMTLAAAHPERTPVAA
jgi:chemotaxis protein histidine kinase CheA